MKHFSPQQPSLRALAFALREPSLWPPGFEWNFHDCDRCALGLARAMWAGSIVKGNPIDQAAWAGQVFGITFSQAADIFLSTGISSLSESYGKNITPDDVAARIDRVLEEV
jgi:hypothetical protein